jgi:hypothetical protein
LHIAASAGCQELVTLLLGLGADKDRTNDAGATPLWAAAAAGHAALVPVLATTSNINLADREGDTPLHAAAEEGHDSVAAALIAAGADVQLGDSQGHAPLIVSANQGHMQVVQLLLAALAKECSKQKGCQQGRRQQQQQQKGQQKDQQQRHARLEELVAAAVAPLAEDATNIPRCAQLLEVVLDVLGPQVAEDVCLQVQRHLLDKWYASDPQHSSYQAWTLNSKPKGSKDAEQLSYLAEALLLGWLGAAERLHAARQPLVARLQRLVPGAGAGGQQPQAVQQARRQPDRYTYDKKAVPLRLMLQEAAVAAALGQLKKALGLLAELAALHLQQPQQQQQQQEEGSGSRSPPSKGGPVPAAPTASSATTPGSHPPTQDNPTADYRMQMAAGGLLMAAWKYRSTISCSQWPGQAAPPVPNMQHTRSFWPLGVYMTFLAAWVGAWRGLQQLPQELEATVVAAVKAAQQHHPQQQGHGVVVRDQQPQLQQLLLLCAPPQQAAVCQTPEKHRLFCRLAGLRLDIPGE